MAEAEAPAPATDPAKEDGSKPHDADTGLEKDLDSVSLGDTSAVRDESPISEDHALLSDDDDDLIIETPQEPTTLHTDEPTGPSGGRNNISAGIGGGTARRSSRRDSIAIGKTFKLVNSKTQVYTTRGPPGPITPRDNDDMATENNQDNNNNVLVILLTNSLGLGSENNLKLADRYVRALNVTVVVPDLFDGDPVANILEQSEQTSAQQQQAEINSQAPVSLLSKVKFMVASTVKGFFDDMWAAKHAFETTNQRLAQTLHELVFETYKPTKVVLVGYSFGAKYVLHYLQSAAAATTNSNERVLAERIVCGACVHPSLLEPLDFAAIEKPLYFVYSRDDDLLPEATVRKCFEVHEDQHGAGVKIETAVYDNAAEQNAASAATTSDGSNNSDDAGGLLPLPHGFAVPGDYPRSVVGDRPDQVFRMLVSWIREHL
ncbi:hypothetical protein DV453_003034 [Geotrichum candidum]|nr:hypothetical protein DV453_003034 [Geotrichum candidum]